jgi:hypothetical protein
MDAALAAEKTQLPPTTPARVEGTLDPLLADFKVMILRYDHEANDLRKDRSEHSRRKRLHIEGIAEGIAWCVRQIEQANVSGQPRLAKEEP